MIKSELYLEPFQTSKVESYVKIVNGFCLITIFAKKNLSVKNLRCGDVTNS